MSYIIDGMRYTKAEVQEIIKDEYNPFLLACDYFDSIEPAVKVAETSGVGQGDIIRGLVAIGRIREEDVVRQFYTSLFRRLGKGETVDLYGMTVSYVPDRTGSKSARPKPKARSASTKPRKAPAKRNPTARRRC